MSNSSQQVSSSNHLIYERLKQAIDLNLRRQIFIAACDDLWLRDCLAARLEAELATPEIGNLPRDPVYYPRFVSLALNLSDPNLWAAIAGWMTQHPPRPNAQGYSRLPGFQILGVEHLTRQSAAVQWSFLSYLRAIESHLQMWESTLLLWVSRPWLSSIEHSAPEFWQWRTGVFEFEGEPTPAREEFIESEDVDDAEDFGERRRFRDEGNWGQKLLIPSVSPQLIFPYSPTAAEWEAADRMKQALIPDFPPAGEDRMKEASIADFPSEGQDSKEEALILDFLKEGEDSKEEAPVRDFQDAKEGEEGAITLDLKDLVLAAAAEEFAAANKTLSADNFEPLQTLQYIELLQLQQSAAAEMAAAYLNLGNFYRDRIQAGDATALNLIIAIRAIEQAIDCIELDRTYQNHSPQTPSGAIATQNLLNLDYFESNSLPPMSDVFNDLGTLYWMLSRDRTEAAAASNPVLCLERSIDLYREGLSQIDAPGDSQIRARLHKNLGIAAADLARYQDKTENLLLAIAAYQQALLDLDPTVEPKQHAAAQNNLATAYWNLAQDSQPAANLKSAIAAYTRALSCYSPEREPLNYAGVQNNLGTACWNLCQHEPSELLLVRAIAAYREALKYRTRELVPAACAATHNNLGTAHWHLAHNFQQKQARTESLLRAIDSYEAALDIATEFDRSQLTFDIEAARSNLALAHYQLATDPDFPSDKAAQTRHLEAALQHQLQAWAAGEEHSQNTALTPNENKLNTHSPAHIPSGDARQTALNGIVKTIRAFYSECGLQGQNLALSQVPGDLLPEILRRL
ncbi:MAG: tetratricopeptide repeat protein [Oscillatoriales cyanobacterium RU_3_3]|nr:tetratricopeptide repeat protein [Oscillatoriales cyanobacterium RU_3_3]